ncbi:MAG TPA: NAD(P)-binding domain-containing protein [Gemmatirosa sp.]
MLTRSSFAAPRPEHRVCVIGAGCAGITTAKALAERGVPFDCYEKGSALGGNWRYDNDNGQSAAYHSLHINSSKWNMQFSDFPMPEDFPHYGHHSDVLRYFERYAEHFGVTPRIQFGTEVTRVVPVAGAHGRTEWDVTVRARDGVAGDGREETRRYGAVAVCNGHHWNPRVPDFPGRFAGEVIHAHDYRRPERYQDRRVLVVGIGNSAVDIAIDLSRTARVTVSTRSGAWIVPKYLLGKPADQWNTRTAELLPPRVRAALYRVLVYLTVGDQARYGMPKPAHTLSAAHPTINQEFLSYVGHGRLAMKPNVRELAGEEVVFDDGTRAAFDTIIYATGYRVTFPFLPREVFDVQDNRVGLYRRVVDPALPGLYFIGLIQPLGSIISLAELQGRWVAGLVAGDCALPNADVMRRSIARDAAVVASRYRASPRHTLQVDFWRYVAKLERGMKSGSRRARRRPAPRIAPDALTTV